ncbi:hematopoietic prostaglandin D synthase-like [Eriocheir sinensis]|uniref:glutathione transferase n=1 Tax=Eriocheir sinensis TaxID=95602 RepID=I6LWU2_ERISI|nr:hematopoietic prostaglandin D synthase-like [Eriocheir sinensis]AEF32709.1 prostaglandin D synthase [Eriocheir sinensis]
MTELKLIYFNAKGLAELSRWMLKYAKIPFTDERVEKADWPERKKAIPGGKLPVLEVEGKMLPQSLAIARFVAKKAGLLPEDPLHAAFCDAVVETLRDVIVDMFKIKNAEDKSEEEKKKILKEEYMPNTLFPLLERLDKRLGDKEWFIGDQISWADFAIARTMEGLFSHMPDLATKFPKIKAHTDKVQNLPGVKEWIATRPDTPS